MGSWISVRNFFYFFGINHKHQRRIQGRNISFTDRRSVLFDLAKAMNIFQEDYSIRLSQVSLQGRLVAEAVLKYFEPDAPNNYGHGDTVGNQIAKLKTASPHLSDLCLLLDRVKNIGNQGAHLTVPSITANDKVDMVDGLYPILTFLRTDVEARWADEAAAATARSTTQVLFIE